MKFNIFDIPYYRAKQLLNNGADIAYIRNRFNYYDSSNILYNIDRNINLSSLNNQEIFNNGSNEVIYASMGRLVVGLGFKFGTRMAV